MVRFELEKQKKQWVVLVLAVVLLLGCYVTTAFRGRMDTMTGQNLSNFWADPVLREKRKSQKAQKIDGAWAAQRQRDYAALVDANCMTQAESEAQIRQFEWLDYSAEEALAHKYDMDYVLGVLPHDVFQAHEGELEELARQLNVLVPMAADPYGYWKADDARMTIEGIPHYVSQGYTEAQHRDDCSIREKHYRDLVVMDGYCLGWDVLVGVMQYLPYTLGMALLLVLGSLFSQERQYAMTPILRTTKRGRRQLLRTKLVLALAVSAGLWLVFQGAMLLAVALSYGLQGAGVTVLYFGCEPNLYGLNWGTYYGIQSVMSFFGTLVFSLMLCLLSSLLPLKTMLPGGLALLVLTGLPIVTFSYAECAFSTLQKLRVLTPPQLMAAYPALQVYQSYSLGNVQLRLPLAMALATVVEGIVFLLLLSRREGGK